MRWNLSHIAGNQKLAGYIYLGANLVEMTHELAAKGEIQNAIPSALFLAASGLMTRFGKAETAFEEWGCRAAGAASIIGLTLLEQQGLSHGDPTVIMGWATYVAAQSLGICRQPLQRLFGAARNQIVKRTVGSPDQVKMGITTGSNATLLISHILSGRLIDSLITASWLTAGVIQGLPRLNTPTAQPSATRPAARPARASQTLAHA